MSSSDEIADSLVKAMFRLCLCGICESSGDGEEYYYFGGSCNGKCCLGGNRVPGVHCHPTYKYTALCNALREREDL